MIRLIRAGACAAGILPALAFALPAAAFEQAVERPRPAGGTAAICTQEYAPVCGRLNGAAVTYTNACRAHADGASVIAQGACGPGQGWGDFRPAIR